MPKCLKCGEKVWEMDLDRNGVCRRCIAAREDKGAAIRAENLDVCRRRCAKPNIQRIFDGFIAKYPDALITGISVQDDGQKLLVYLDGKPMYYVTHNPLTNSVDLVSHQEAEEKAAEDAKKAAEAADQASREKSAGCSIWLSIVGVIYGALCLLFSSVGGFAGLVCSLIVLAGGISKSRFAVILGGVLSLVSVFLGFPYTILFALFGIFYICVGSDM